MAPEAISPVAVLNPTASTDNNNNNNSSNDSNSGNGQGKMRLGRPSDVWPLGIILYQLCYGRPPFASLSTVQKLSAIPNPHYQIPYPDYVSVCPESAFPSQQTTTTTTTTTTATTTQQLVQQEVDRDMVDSIQACLRHNPKDRAPIGGTGGLLSMAFLQLHPQRTPNSVPPSVLPATTASPSPAVPRSEGKKAHEAASVKRCSLTSDPTTSSLDQVPYPNLS